MEITRICASCLIEVPETKFCIAMVANEIHTALKNARLRVGKFYYIDVNIYAHCCNAGNALSYFYPVQGVSQTALFRL